MPGGDFLRIFDGWNIYSGALWAGTGAWMTVPRVPSGTVRVELGAALTATISFAVLELAR